MNSNIEILTTYRQKIPSWKVDIVQILNTLRPRKTRLPGHFHLKTTLTPVKLTRK